GDRWYMAHAGEGCESFEVLDAGTMQEDGVELRWLDLNNVSVRIVERIGSLWEFLPFCPPNHIDGMGGLRCYTDDEIHYQGTGWNSGCTSLVSIDEMAADPIKLFPNPGNDHFNLQLPPGLHHLMIFNALGRTVLKVDRISDQAVIDASSLRSGIYLIQITDRSGRAWSERWIKE
ncbi:MAG: T9SS type A sorting domain-containing protein, partial [Bacteroidota bacterium]|nr:T9SS type A sorting domain-containing protein [Bacteroidota bacterium]